MQRRQGQWIHSAVLITGERRWIGGILGNFALWQVPPGWSTAVLESLRVDIKGLTGSIDSKRDIYQKKTAIPDLLFLSFPFFLKGSRVNERSYQMFHARVRSRLRVCVTVNRNLHTKNSIKDRHRSLLDLILYLQLLDSQCTTYTENHRLLVMLMIEIVIIKPCHSSLIIQAGMSDFTYQ